jgi:hypothetical protein
VEDQLNEMCSRYNWSFKNFTGYNSKGSAVFTIECRKGRAIFRDMAGNKLLTGAADNAPATLQKLLIEYYYCKPL